MLDARLLQAAVVVAEERSITRAAERLGLTQPALSKQVAEVEDRVGTPLFERSSQRFEVTEAGAAFVEHARISLAEADRAVQSAKAAALGAEHVICVSKSPYVDPYISSIIRSIKLPLYPNLELRFTSHFSGEAVRLLRSGEADLAVVIGLTEQSGITSIKLNEDVPYLALSSSDDLAAKRDLTLADMNGRKWVLFERHVNPTIYDRLRRALEDDGIGSSEIQHVQQAEEAAALILARGSMALLTKAGAWRIADDAITLRPLRDERLLLKTYLSARLEESSRVVADFHRAIVKKLQAKPVQGELALAG